MYLIVVIAALVVQAIPSFFPLSLLLLLPELRYHSRCSTRNPHLKLKTTPSPRLPMTTTTARGERAEAHGRSGRRRKIEIPLFNLINLIFIAFAWKWRVLFGLVGVRSWFVVSGRSCQICASILVSPSSLLLRLRLFSSCPVSLCFIDFESNFNSIFCFFLLLLLLFSLVLFFWLAAFFSGRIRHQKIFQCRSCA